MRISHYQKLNFEISNQSGVDPSKANPLLEQLYKKLDGLTYKDTSFSARIVDVDQLHVDQVTPNMLSCAYRIIRWDIVADDENWTYNYNNVIPNKLGAFLGTLEYKRYGAYLKVIGIG